METSKPEWTEAELEGLQDVMTKFGRMIELMKSAQEFEIEKSGATNAVIHLKAAGKMTMPQNWKRT